MGSQSAAEYIVTRFSDNSVLQLHHLLSDILEEILKILIAKSREQISI